MRSQRLEVHSAEQLKLLVLCSCLRGGTDTSAVKICKWLCLPFSLNVLQNTSWEVLNYTELVLFWIASNKWDLRRAHIFLINIASTVSYSVFLVISKSVLTTKSTFHPEVQKLTKPLWVKRTLEKSQIMSRWLALVLLRALPHFVFLQVSLIYHSIKSNPLQVLLYL